MLEEQASIAKVTRDLGRSLTKVGNVHEVAWAEDSFILWYISCEDPEQNSSFRDALELVVELDLVAFCIVLTLHGEHSCDIGIGLKL